MKGAMASKVEGKGLARNDAMTMGEKGWNVRGKVQIVLFRMINLGTEKIWFMFAMVYVSGWKGQ